MNTELIQNLTQNIATRRVAVNITISKTAVQYLKSVVQALKARGIDASRSAAVDQIVLWAASQLPAETLAASSREATPQL